MRSSNFHVSQNVPTDSPCEVLITDAIKNEIHVSQVPKIRIKKPKPKKKIFSHDLQSSPNSSPLTVTIEGEDVDNQKEIAQNAADDTSPLNCSPECPQAETRDYDYAYYGQQDEELLKLQEFYNERRRQRLQGGGGDGGGGSSNSNNSGGSGKKPNRGGGGGGGGSGSNRGNNNGGGGNRNNPNYGSGGNSGGNRGNRPKQQQPTRRPPPPPPPPRPTARPTRRPPPPPPPRRTTTTTTTARPPRPAPTTPDKDRDDPYSDSNRKEEEEATFAPPLSEYDFDYPGKIVVKTRLKTKRKKLNVFLSIQSTRMTPPSSGAALAPMAATAAAAAIPTATRPRPPPPNARGPTSTRASTPAPDSTPRHSPSAWRSAGSGARDEGSLFLNNDLVYFIFYLIRENNTRFC